MQFIVNFSIYFLCWWWLVAIIYRTGVLVKIYNRYPSNFLDKLTDCDLCIESHLSILLSTVCFIFTGQESFLFFAIMAPALSNLLK